MMMLRPTRLTAENGAAAQVSKAGALALPLPVDAFGTQIPPPASQILLREPS